MDLKDIGTQIAEAMHEPIETMHDIRSKQRERWFKTGENGKKVEQRETYEIEGVEHDFAVIGMESPDKLVLSKVSVSTNSDMQSETDSSGLQKLVCSLHSHSDKTADVNIVIEFERIPASEGIMALHKRAVREIKQACMAYYPEVAEQEVKEAEVRKSEADAEAATAQLALSEKETDDE